MAAAAEDVGAGGNAGTAAGAQQVDGGSVISEGRICRFVGWKRQDPRVDDGVQSDLHATRLPAVCAQCDPGRAAARLAIPTFAGRSSYSGASHLDTAADRRSLRRLLCLRVGDSDISIVGRTHNPWYGSTGRAGGSVPLESLRITPTRRFPRTRSGWRLVVAIHPQASGISGSSIWRRAQATA